MKRFMFTIVLLFNLITFLQAGCPPDHFPKQQSIYDVYFDACQGWNSEGTYGFILDGIDFYQKSPELTFSRQVVLHEQQKLHLPEIPENAFFNFHYVPIIVQLEIFDSGGNIVQNYPVLTSNQTLDLNLNVGLYNLKFTYTYFVPPAFETISNEIEFEVKKSDYSYEMPDEIWQIETDDVFTPPCSNAYPTDPDNPLSKYTIPSNGEANVYIKYGEGNSTITRPIIMVEGLDLLETSYFDPETGDVVRHGSNGWENVSQGLIQAFIKDGTPETFANYPEMIKNLGEDYDDEGLDNFDIIVLDFKDGADYIQKNSQLLIKLLELVNNEKSCDYDNIIIGLSMGGQVARHALATMEKDGIDHQTSTYVSYDSPHVLANIPLSMQAFAWTMANFSEDLQSNVARNAQNALYGANRPAALQLLDKSFNAAYQNELIDIEIDRKNYFSILFCEFVPLDSIDPSNYFDLSLEYSCLRESYKVEMEELGYPMRAINVAIANGSGNGGMPLFNDGTPLLNASKNCYFIELISGNGHGGNKIYHSFLPHFDDSEAYTVFVKLNEEIPFIDGTSGGTRNDIANVFAPQISSSLNVNLAAASLCFTPSTSTIGYETDDFTIDVDNIVDTEMNLIPFDKIHTSNNDQHVWMGQPYMNFLDGVIEDAKKANMSNLILPDEELGSIYNFGAYNKKIPQAEINKKGELNINKIGSTGYVEIDPQENSIRDNFRVYITPRSCEIEAIASINDGGTLTLGDQNKDNKNGELVVGKNALLEISEKAHFNWYNNSKLEVEKGGELHLKSSRTINMQGQESELKINGTLTVDGDLTIITNGLVHFGPNASINISGNLTIIGDQLEDQLLIIEDNVSINLTHNLSISNGIIDMDSNSKFQCKNTSLNPESSIFISDVKVVNQDLLDETTFFEFMDYRNIDIINFETNDNLNNVTVKSSGANLSCSIYIENAMAHNNHLTFQLEDCQSLTILDSDFTSGDLNGEYEYANGNGVSITNANQVSIIDSYFDGFGLEENESNENFAIKLENSRITNVTGSAINSSGIGIYVPESGLGANETNLYVRSSTLYNNQYGIEMHGTKAEGGYDSYNWGYLYLTCANIIDNKKAGVYGTDILVQADMFFGKGSGFVNYFRALGKPFNSCIFDVTYYSYDFTDVYLRGNAWYSQTYPCIHFFNANTGSYLNAHIEPRFQSDVPLDECLLTSDPYFGGELQCDDCTYEDAEDCVLKVTDKDESIADIMQEGTQAVGSHELDEASDIFDPLASLDQSELDESSAKCQFAYEVSRVFSLGDNGNEIEPRSEKVFTNKDTKITPNPSASMIQIDIDSPCEYTIVSSGGEKVMNGNYLPDGFIDISELPTGMYFIEYITNEKTQLDKFIKIN